MGIRFNRNHPSAADDKFYIDDYRADIGYLEERIKDAIVDFENLPAIVEGLLLSTDPDAPIVHISPGSAYDIEGRKIVVPAVQDMGLQDLSGGPNYILLRYKEEYSTRRAFYTGAEYPARVHDSFEILVTDTYSDEDIVLGNVVVVDSIPEVHYNERTPYISKPQIQDEFPPPPPTITEISTSIQKDTFYELLGYAPYSYVEVVFNPVSDPSGISHYVVQWVPVDSKNSEIPVDTLSLTTTETTVRIKNIPTGQRGKVKVQAVDRSGNLSDFRESNIIIAGRTSKAPSAPSITLSQAFASVILEITPSDVAGYEVYIGINSSPTIKKENLMYRGKKTRHIIPAEKNTTIYVAVRSYTEDLQFSPVSYASASPSYDNSYLNPTT